jgi:3-methyladenine DNA glycosylase AlkD
MAHDVVRLIVEGLFEHADPARAVQSRRYLKSDREFLGVSVPDGRRVVRAVVGSAETADGPFDAEGLRSIATTLWAGDLFESRRAAVEVLMFRSAVLGPDDLGFLAGMIRAGETWALVDPLAGDVAGSIVARDMTDDVGASLDEWSVDENFWLRRASMLALLLSLRRDDRDWERFGRYADSMLGEREFFIRKAIGWVLRDESKRRPDQVRAWVEPRLDRMSGVTRREAVKYLDQGMT